MEAAASLIRKKVESWQIDLGPLDEAGKIQVEQTWMGLLTEMKLAPKDAPWAAARRALGFSENFMELRASERNYLAAQRTFEQYQTGVLQRNPKRAVLEAQFGYD